jgi:hypothetical protein
LEWHLLGLRLTDTFVDFISKTRIEINIFSNHLSPAALLHYYISAPNGIFSGISVGASSMSNGGGVPLSLRFGPDGLR